MSQTLCKTASKFEKGFQDIGRRSSRSLKYADLASSRFCFAKNGKEMKKELRFAAESTENISAMIGPLKILHIK